MASSNSEAAARGTVCHQFGERYLTEGKLMPASHIGDVVVSGGIRVEVNVEVWTATNVYIEAVRSLIKPGDEFVLEGQIDLAPLGFPVPCYGVADARIYSPAKRTLRVVDGKFGKKSVPAKENRQLRTYGLGAMLSMPKDKPIDKVITTIVQPTTKRVTVSEELTIGELAFWTLDLRDAMRASVEAREARKTMQWEEWAFKYLKPGSHCYFCPRTLECPVKAYHSAKVDQFYEEVA